jgi:hypothetical protein
MFIIRTKHIDIRYHYIREKVADGTITINKIDSNDNLADIFTKALSRVLHEFLTSGLGLVDNSTEGGMLEIGQ